MEKQQNSLMIDRVLELLSIYIKRGLTGKIEIKLPSQETIAIYLNLGFIAWISDSIHSQRRWERSLKQAGINLEKIQLINDFLEFKQEKTEVASPSEYDHLVAITKENLLNKEQVTSIISYLTQEILFDLSQKAQQQMTEDSNLPFSIEFYPRVRPSDKNFLPYTWLCSLSHIADLTRETYQQWLALGLIKYSPNSIPIINNYQKLSSKTNSETYHKITTLLNGENSFREIATKMNRDLATIIQSLSPLIKEEIITCETTQHQVLPKTSSSVKQASAANISPLRVAAIDDSPHTLKILEYIVTDADNHWTGVSNPVEALPILLENPPDLIFLDLMMPIMNGYELCAKIRKVNTLKTVPIIILSGNLISQVRAKLMGATDCLEKPLVTHKVISIINYYQQQKTEQEDAIPLQFPGESELQAG